MRWAGFLLVGAAWATAPVPEQPELIQWDPFIKHYVDRQGRARIFHGVNVVYKEFPWYPAAGAGDPELSLADEDIDLLEKWGFNVVRLGVMWPGVEPRRGHVDEAYLREVRNITERLARRGVYTILDLHQDVGSRHFCGEGFPEHYVEELLKDPTSAMHRAAPFPVAANASSGFPLLEECLKKEFAGYYITERVGALWRSLYEPGTPLNNGFVRFWSAVASEFANATQVLAYELLNEPSGWCLGSRCLPTLPVGNKVEEQYLAPLYRAAARQIRAKDKHHIILMEPTVTPKPTAPVFKEPPLGADTQQGLAYHIYCQPGDENGTVADLICKAAQDLYGREFFGFLESSSMAGFMTECGAVGQSEGELGHLSRLFGFADSHFQSWAYWQLKLFKDFTTANADESFYDGQGKLETAKLRALSRTYARAVAGTPVSMNFDPADASFELAFRAAVGGRAPTEVYVNEELHYPAGYDVAVSPEGCLTVEPRRNLVLLFLAKDHQASCLEQELRVSIKAKRPQTSELIL